jgi:hypothetical protein
MRRIHSSAIAAVLAITSSAWAGSGPYSADTDVDPAPGKTRSAVVAELHEAQRLGLMSNSESDFPTIRVGGASANTFSAGDPRTVRARLHAEAVEAGRLGVLNSGEGNPPIATASQEELIAAAGRRAVDDIQTAQRVVGATGR